MWVGVASTRGAVVMDTGVGLMWHGTQNVSSLQKLEEGRIGALADSRGLSGIAQLCWPVDFSSLKLF